MSQTCTTAAEVCHARTGFMFDHPLTGLVVLAVAAVVVVGWNYWSAEIKA